MGLSVSTCWCLAWQKFIGFIHHLGVMNLLREFFCCCQGGRLTARLEGSQKLLRLIMDPKTGTAVGGRPVPAEGDPGRM